VTPELCGVFARYNRWMNQKLYAVSSKLEDEDRKRDRGAFFKSIHGTLNHILVGDRTWMGRFTGAKLEHGWMGPGGIRSLDQELYADFEELQRERAKTDAEILQWVATLSAQRLAEDLRFVRNGVPVEAPLWCSVAHFFNHQTHHRGQVTTLLLQAGQDPGVTDLVAMLREEAARAKEGARPGRDV
jgi:uncharacterized damage-inducible protein DinB